MFEIDKIKFQNAGRFVDVQEVDFSVPGLTAFDGDNQNTNGSSGAGKSTVFAVFDYAFGCNSISATDLQSRLTKESLWVEVYGRYDGMKVKITRSKKNGLSIVVGNEEISGNNALAEAKIDEIIKIPRTLFKKLIHKKQGEGGHFLSLTNAKASEFLIECLGLREIEEKASSCSKKASDLEDDIENDNYDLEKFAELIAENEGSKKLLAHPGDKPESERLDTLKGDLKMLESQLFLYEKQNKEAIKKLIEEKPEENKQFGDIGDVVSDETVYGKLNGLKKEIEGHKQEIESILNNQREKQIFVRQEIRKIEQEIMGFIAIKSSIEKAQSDAITLKKEVDHFVVDKCPTCLQNWDSTNLLKDKQETLKKLVVAIQGSQEQLKGEQKFQDKLKELETVQSKLEEKPKEVSSLETSLEALQQDHSKLKNDQNLKESIRIAEYKTNLAIYEKKVQEVTHGYQIKIQNLNQQSVELKSEIRSIEVSLESYDTLLANYTKQLDHYKSNIKEHKAKLTKTKESVAENTKQRDIELESARALKLYLLEVFEDTLIEIGERATELVNRIPNMSTATIEYRGEKENKKGTIKKEICPYLTLDGETVPLKTLSGGERCSIDLVVDFAVEEIIETRSGVGASWKVLDEPFDGLDAVCKEQCLELIAYLSRNKKVFIVDHSSETKEIFSDIITVQRDGLYSNIVNVI